MLKADGDLVNDDGVEDGRDIVDHSDDRPRDDARRLSRHGDMADHSNSQHAAPFHSVREVLGEPAGPDHQHEARVVAAAAQASETGPQGRPPRERHERLDDEQGQQEEPAHVDLLQDEQRRKGECHDDDRRSEDVQGLRLQAPAGAQAVEPVVPERDHPPDPEEHRCQPDIDAESLPDRQPLAVAEPNKRDQEKDDRGAGTVGQHQAEPERHQVPSDHAARVPSRR